MADGYYLTPQLKEAVISLLKEWDQRSQNTRNRPFHVEETSQSPEVYIARSPAGGIPALEEALTGTAYDDVPGSTDCDIYQLLRTTPPSIVRCGFTKTVYNLAVVSISAHHWVPVVRDKWGTWLVFWGAVGLEFSTCNSTGAFTGTIP